MVIEDENAKRPPFNSRQPSEPAFNAPGAVLVTILALVAVHAARVFLLGDMADGRFVIDLAFIPGCYATDCVLSYDRDVGASVWSPLTHALLHADWMHLGLNTIWLLAFGTPVARRLGALRYCFFMGVGALAGAAFFYALNPTLLEPVVGASGVVSALMGGACRFAFGPQSRRTGLDGFASRLTIPQALTDRTILVFIVLFFATNLLTATSFGGFLAGGGTIAWEAHLGGFAFGFLAFSLFDRPPTRAG